MKSKAFTNNTKDNEKVIVYGNIAERKEKSKMKKRIFGFIAGIVAASSIVMPVAGHMATECVLAAQTGWVYDTKSKAYKYYDNSGRAYTGWHWMTAKEGEKTAHWSYFGNDGAIRTGWQQMGKGTSNPDGNSAKHWSYFGANGWLRTGWQQLGKGTSNPDGNAEKHWSYFGANGWLRTGWVQLGKGTSEPDGNTAKHFSYFGPNGWLRTGMQTMGKGTANPDGDAPKHNSYFGGNGWLVTSKEFVLGSKKYIADSKGWLTEVVAGKIVDTNSTSKTDTTSRPVTFTVTFTDGNGKTLVTRKVEKGKSATPPAAPAREGYEFTGWDKSYNNISSNVTINAKWKKIPTLDEIRTGILKAVNKVRREAGKSELKLNKYINETAQEKTEDMVKNKDLNHYSNELGWVDNQFYAHGIKALPIGENIAYTGSFDVEYVMQVWLNSDGHRENILDSEYTDIGVGYCNGYWTQQFACNPVKGEPVDTGESVYVKCPNCNEKLNTKYLPHGWKIDKDGTTHFDGYGVSNYYQCAKCSKNFYLCPECGLEALSVTGTDKKSGINTYKCKKCGFVPMSKYIAVCSGCGKRLDDHHAGNWYTVNFQYSNKANDFQQISIYLDYCPETGKYNFAEDDSCSLYKEMIGEMQKNYKTNKDILDNITWYKETSSGVVRVSNPRVLSLRDILNKNVLK